MRFLGRRGKEVRRRIVFIRRGEVLVRLDLVLEAVLLHTHAVGLGGLRPLGVFLYQFLQVVGHRTASLSFGPGEAMKKGRTRVRPRTALNLIGISSGDQPKPSPGLFRYGDFHTRIRGRQGISTERAKLLRI